MGELSIERDEVFRIRTERVPGLLAKALAAAGEHGANIGEIETVHIGADHNIREVAIIAPDDESLRLIADAMARIEGVELLPGQVDKVWEQHKDGKIRIVPNATVRTLQDIREVYTPGVARVVSALVDDPSLAQDLTWKGNTIAVVTNGSRVLGLGDVGPLASLPVMEGKALFYAEMVDVNAVPLVVDATDPDELVGVIQRIADGFGGIHLEDIATPGVYEVERRLEADLPIPVFHDDQHGTAVVVAAAIISATRRTSQDIESLTFGQVGLGAAGSAIAGLASGLGFRRVLAFDPYQGGVDRLHEVADPAAEIDASTSEEQFDRVIAEADVLVLTTGRAGLLEPSRVKEGQIIMALTNPLPEITPNQAREAGAAVAADGSIVNNVLSFPGIFRGALDARATSVTLKMKRAAAFALAEATPEGELLPEPLDASVHHAVAAAVASAWTDPA